METWTTQKKYNDLYFLVLKKCVQYVPSVLKWWNDHMEWNVRFMTQGFSNFNLHSSSFKFTEYNLHFFLVLLDVAMRGVDFLNVFLVLIFIIKNN